jgi:hypothetical protein
MVTLTMNDKPKLGELDGWGAITLIYVGYGPEMQGPSVPKR